ncbi:MAG: UbiA family prenyltransferase [Candidatus Thermoplasmatota archaeon]|nr:UbiA family prenyltransferase [Candidatus Thermoplasmatota archaeon]
MLAEYFKLVRSFNLALTAIAPVLGALAMAPENICCLALFVLFLIGACSHVYGFVLNDYLDVRVDKLTRELKDRPLVSGTIKKSASLKLAFSALLLSWILTLFFYQNLTQWLKLLLLLIIADSLATTYNFTSKKLPAMDFSVACAVYFLIIFGSATVSFNLTALAVIVALIGFAQVLYMNMINGGLKDIDHDWLANAKTVAVKLGTRVIGNNLKIPSGLKACAYSIITFHAVLIFSPFAIANLNFCYWQIAVLTVFLLLEIYFASKLLFMKKFNRQVIRKNIGLEVIFMYALAPLVLSSINVYISLLALVPPSGFVISNLVLHKSALKPKTM